jgi:hypothetical protein
LFEPWPTTGVPLADREDWRSVLEAAAAAGVLHLWVAFHGVGEVHDRQVSHRGAFAGTCVAIERARAAGLSVGGNVFLTAESLPQLDELVGIVSPLAGTCFESAAYLPTPRSRRNERLRLTLPDLAPVAPRLEALADPVNCGFWKTLEARTEAAYVRQALAGEWPPVPDPAPGELALVCRPNLDVYSGLAGLYRVRHGNLRTDGAAAVLGRALARGRERDDALWFGPGPLPAPDELAARFGDRKGLKVHPFPESARYRWLDRAQSQVLGVIQNDHWATRSSRWQHGERHRSRRRPPRCSRGAGRAIICRLPTGRPARAAAGRTGLGGPVPWPWRAPWPAIGRPSQAGYGQRITGPRC